jgi:hypothetical protein
LNDLTHIGLGGAVAYIIIREVLMFLARKKNGGENGASGDKSPSYWREEIRKTVEQALHAEFSSRNEELRRLIREEMTRRR